MQDLDAELRRRLRAIAETGERAARPPQPEEVHRRGVRHYRRLATTLVALLVVAVAGGARLLPLGNAAARSAASPTSATPTTSAPPATTAPPVTATTDQPATTGSATTATTQATAATTPEPGVLFGGVGGGHEREVVISVASGKILRYLSPPPGSQAIGALSPDRRTYYEPAADSACAASWRAIDVASGRITPAFGGEADVQEVAFSPDGRKLALLRARSAQGGCARELVVRDLATGHARSWPVGEDRLHYLVWSPDSTRLAYKLSRQLYVVTVATMRSVDDGLVVGAPSAGCEFYYPQFRADSGRLVAAEQCSGGANGGIGAGTLLEYDPATGTLVGTLLRLPGDNMVTDLSIDASGQHVLVLLFPNAANSVPTAYALRNGRLAPVFTGAYTAAW
jgi:hypothetical protein